MMERTEIKEAITRILRHHLGPDAPIKMVDLFRITTGQTVIPGRKYDQTRITRSVVDQLRAEGWPICYASGGYYLARDWTEMQTTVDHLERRAIASFRTAAHLRRCSVKDLLRHYQQNLPMEEENNGNT